MNPEFNICNYSKTIICGKMIEENGKKYEYYAHKFMNINWMSYILFSLLI